VILDESKNEYNASSPDELALVNAAKYFGVIFEKRDEDNNMIVRLKDGEVEKYKLLNTLEFTSSRKRMSVIIKDENDGRIRVLTKGADSVILPRLDTERSEFQDETNRFLEQYATEGLRTLVLAEKELEIS